jgi:hypothetical protein
VSESAHSGKRWWAGAGAVLASLACGGLPPSAVGPAPPLPPLAGGVEDVGPVPTQLTLPARPGDLWGGARVLEVVNGQLYLGLGDRALWVSPPAGPPRRLTTATADFVGLGGHAGRLVWGTETGVWTAAPDGTDTAQLYSGQVSALVAGSAGIYFTTPTHLYGSRELAAPAPLIETHVLFPGELALNDVLVAFVDHGSGDVSVYDLNAAAPTRLAAGLRGPHALTSAGTGFLWVEGEADLLPGREPDAFRATLGPSGWALDRVRLDLSTGDARSAHGCVFAAASCAAWGGSWTRFDHGEGSGPTAVLGDWFYWTVMDTAGGRLVRAPLDRCPCLSATAPD